jgi:hypothetical protein
MTMLRPLLPSSLPALVGLLLTTATPADTIILKNGTRYEGRVLTDQGDSYLLEIQVTRSIRDERRVPKAEIEKIEKIDPSNTAFADLAQLADTPDLLSDAGYQARLRQLNDFLADYPASKHNRDVRELIARLETEQKAIAAGSVKLGGRLISPAERQADAVAIDAAVLAQQMREAAEAGSLIEALRIFDSLDHQFAGAQPHREALDLAKRVLTTLRGQVAGWLASLESRLNERKVGLDRMPDDDRQRAVAIFKQQQQALQAKQAAEKAAGVKWASLDHFDKKNLDETLRRIDSESNRLDRLDPSRLTAPDQAYRTAWTQLEGADDKQTKSILNEVKRARLPETYFRALEQRAAEVAARTPPAPPAK